MAWVFSRVITPSPQSTLGTKTCSAKKHQTLSLQRGRPATLLPWLRSGALPRRYRWSVEILRYLALPSGGKPFDTVRRLRALGHRDQAHMRVGEPDCMNHVTVPRPASSWQVGHRAIGAYTGFALQRACPEISNHSHIAELESCQFVDLRRKGHKVPRGSSNVKLPRGRQHQGRRILRYCSSFLDCSG